MTYELPHAIACLPTVVQPKAIVFCDFDGTYLRSPSSGNSPEVAALEDFLASQCIEQALLFGWVAGSSLEGLRGKTERGGLRYWPHFISCALGSELWLCSQNEGLTADRRWEDRIGVNGFTWEKAKAVVDALCSQGIALESQPAVHHTARKFACYYRAASPARDEEAFQAIRDISAKVGMTVKITRCGVGVGDPEDCYDVDFLPMGSGKDAAVRHVLDAYGVPPSRAMAIGDSQNDMDMLDLVGQAYLVANADEHVRSRGYPVLRGSGAGGVLEALKLFLKNGSTKEDL